MVEGTQAILRDDAEYFDSCVDLIPPKFFFADRLDEWYDAGGHSRAETVVAMQHVLSESRGSATALSGERSEVQGAAWKRQNVDRDRFGRKRKRAEILALQAAAGDAKAASVLDSLQNKKRPRSYRGREDEDKSSLVTSAVIMPKIGESAVDRRRQRKFASLRGQVAARNDREQLKLLQDQSKILGELGTTAEGVAMRKELSMQRALSKASGVSVKDDSEKLKKSIKRSEKRKEKNRDKWRERAENVRKQKLERQQKRQQNIQDFVARKKDKNASTAQQRPRRPGFEGRK